MLCVEGAKKVSSFAIVAVSCDLRICPGGLPDNSPAFQRRDPRSLNARPEGTLEMRVCKNTLMRPSLRDSFRFRAQPGVKTPGCSQSVPAGTEEPTRPRICCKFPCLWMCSIVLGHSVYVLFVLGSATPDNRFTSRSANPPFRHKNQNESAQRTASKATARMANRPSPVAAHTPKA